MITVDDQNILAEFAQKYKQIEAHIRQLAPLELVKEQQEKLVQSLQETLAANKVRKHLTFEILTTILAPSRATNSSA